MKTLLIPLLALSLTACATNRMSDTDRLTMYQAYAGQPVKQIRYYDPIGWETVDDSHVLLNMRPKESWLLRLSGPCLKWSSGSPFLHLSSQSGFVMAKFDKVTWRAGLVYLADNGFAPYASYATSFQPQIGTGFFGQTYVPTTGESAGAAPL